MTEPEEAVLIWPVLLLAARTHKTLTYGEIEGLTGIFRAGLGRPLFLIHTYCDSKSYPKLNSIAVSAETGFPSHPGYPDKKSQTEILIEQTRVFAFNWTEKDKPRKEDFDASRSAAA